jgi:hypothetical protein
MRHCTPPSSKEITGIARGLFEYLARGASFAAPGFLSSTPQGGINFGKPASAGQVNGCTFFGSFLYASKEMNIKRIESNMLFSYMDFTLFITNPPA